MKHSETIGKLAEALSKAQGEMANAAKDRDNTYFNSPYADLASVWSACRDPLSKNGLAVIQAGGYFEGKMVLTTKIIHTSGEWISGELPINPVRNDLQGLGSAITYCRRYSLAAIVGIAPAEDDGEAAVGRGKAPEAKPQPKPGPKLVSPPAPFPGTFVAYTGAVGLYRMSFGRFKGKTLAEVPNDALAAYFREVQAKSVGRAELSKPVAEFLNLCGEYLFQDSAPESISPEFNQAVMFGGDPRDGIK